MADYRIDHVHLRSEDPAAAAAFYAEMFGATEAGRMRNGDALRVVVQLGGATLFIEQVPADTPAPPPPPYKGVEHIGLAVTGFDAAVAELRKKGAVFAKEPTSPRPGIQIAFVQAPDGVQVEILERTAG